MITGGCFCGSVRIEIDDGQYRSVNCYCTMCRRIHAAPYVTWLVVPENHFRYVSSEPRRLASSKDGSRFFCPDCGTHLACTNTKRPDQVEVPVCCLDSPEQFPPTDGVYKENRLDFHDDV